MLWHFLLGTIFGPALPLILIEVAVGAMWEGGQVAAVPQSALPLGLRSETLKSAKRNYSINFVVISSTNNTQIISNNSNEARRDDDQNDPEQVEKKKKQTTTI